ncbi:MAG: alpha-amylase family glycosyl hydrolase [Hyphomicrobiales bacterium]
MTQDPQDDRAAQWWQDAVVYQVYLRSFQDSDGDGIGDLDGVIARLDYVVRLGADALWLSPFHPSPMLDGGYDIEDFRAVHPLFGSLDTFDRLLEAAHRRGLKVILDFVPNHTSDQHPWFRESRSGRDNPRRDWYIWRDPAPDGGPPNGWRSMLDSSAWTRDPTTEQYYYHAFLPEQPDLNWRNPEVQAAIDEVLRFWLDRGVDGFRVDAVPHLVEDDLLREDPPGDLAGEGLPVQAGVRHAFTSDRPETHACAAAWRRLLDRYGDRLLIGEAHLPVERVMRYYGLDAPAFHLPFNFVLLNTAWDARALSAAIDQYLNLLPPGAWPNWVLGNHDEQRLASRIGPEAARVAAMLAFTAGGTAFVYNGDELGLEDVEIAPSEAHRPDAGGDRDPQRTPMPWDDSPQGGFTSGTPWLPLGHANAERSVSAQEVDPRSMLVLYRHLIDLRRTYPALVRGRFQPRASEGTVLSYVREWDGTRLLVALNIGGSPAKATLHEPGTLLLSTRLDHNRTFCTGQLILRPDEGVLVHLG